MQTFSEEPRSRRGRASSGCAALLSIVVAHVFAPAFVASGFVIRRATASIVTLVLLVGIASGCKRTDRAPIPASRPPAPAPEGLVAELIIAHPDRTWDTLRSKLRATAALVPNSPAVFLGGALGLPLGVLDQLDFNIPIVGAVLEEKGALSLLLAIHVRDGLRTTELMTSATPAFIKSQKPKSEITHLAPATPDPEGQAFAIAGNYLVVGQGPEVLERGAPFLTRTLSTRPLPDEDVVVTATAAALGGPVTARLTQLWQKWKKDREADDLAMRAKHGGSAPDFGDPAEALADMDAKAARFLAVLADLEEARFAFRAPPDTPETTARYRGTLAMKARPTGPASEEIATMTVGGIGELLALPESVAIAFLTRDNAKARERTAISQVEALGKIFGGRMAESDRAKIETALRTVAEGRGDWLTGGMLWAGPLPAAFVRGAVTDPAAIDRGAFLLLDLLSVRAIADPVANWIGDLKVSGIESARAAQEGARRMVHVVRRPPKVRLARDKNDKAADHDAFDVAWSAGKDLFVGAAGRDVKSTLESLEKRDERTTLGRDAYLNAIAARLGPSVAFALLIDPGRFGSAAAKDAERAILLTYGKPPGQNARASIELDAPAALVMSYAQALATQVGASP